jgi:hypothetical protein
MENYPYRTRNQGVNQFDEIVIGDNVRILTGEATSTTSTSVVALAIDVNEDELVQVRVFATGREAAGGEDSAAFGVVGLFRRDTSGNVTQIGSDTDIFTAINSDSWAGPTLVANTSDQTVDIKVEGKVSTTVLWKLRVEYEKIVG